MVADRRCRPVARLTPPGQDGDSPRFVPVLERVRIRRTGRGRPRQRPARVMADKAYSSKANRGWLRGHGISAVIPVKEDQKANRRRLGPARPGDVHRRSTRGCTGSATRSSAVSANSSSSGPATRYDKRDVVFQGTIDVASIQIWLRTPTT